MIELNKKEVGLRLKEFGIDRFGTISELALKLEMDYQSFHSTYIQGRSLPGAKILSKLMQMGCNIDWLLHGKKN